MKGEQSRRNMSPATVAAILIFAGCLTAHAADEDLVSYDLAKNRAPLAAIEDEIRAAGDAAALRAIEDRLIEALKKGHDQEDGGTVLNGGNCLGIVSKREYNTFFLPLYKLPFTPARGGNLAIVSQSGAYLVTFASNYDGVIQPAASISFGNQMDLTAGDFLEHFTDRDGIDVIAVYVEGFRPGDGARFLDQARRARAAGKRVNLERALRLGARVGGHLVQGHVDGVVRLLSIRDQGAFSRWRMSLPAACADEVAAKGSIAVQGVSLTVADLVPDATGCDSRVTHLRVNPKGNIAGVSGAGGSGGLLVANPTVVQPPQEVPSNTRARTAYALPSTSAAPA